MIRSAALLPPALTTQFAQPGWKYLGDACGLLPGGGSYVSLAAPDGKEVSADALIEGAGDVALFGRVANVPQQKKEFQAYCLKVDDSGS